MAKVLPKLPDLPVLKTKDLLDQFASQYNSFLSGFLADHGGKTAPSLPSALSGATLQSLMSTTPRRGRLQIDFEGSYRPSQSRMLSSRSLGKDFHGDSQGTLTGRGRNHNHHEETPRRGASGVKLAPLHVGAGGKDTVADGDAMADTTEEEEVKEREACESLRTLVLGGVGHEHLAEKDRPAFFAHLRRGTNQEVERFANMWFIAYFNKRRVDRLLGIRCVRWLMPKVTELGQDGVTKDDMLRLMWLQATDDDIEHMNVVFDHCRLRAAAVKPPKVLRRQRRLELLDIFGELDRDKTGFVPFAELNDIGISDHSMIALLSAKYDRNRDGFFDRAEFLEMLAPMGYRAHPKAEGCQVVAAAEPQMELPSRRSWRAFATRPASCWARSWSQESWSKRCRTLLCAANLQTNGAEGGE
eukprot:TRINITY_DN4780_c0_g1_i1.p1 TRINITY_DN4780_c0_g1~~TRINITY_DN4780_c0_g1_i1.p1  ORF type:complete len:414 (+),score=85.47 TRINITY_DN4780_c0_g1_i1:124-1365(+)